MHIGLLRLHIELTKCTNLLEETLNLSVCVAMVTDSRCQVPCVVVCHRNRHDGRGWSCVWIGLGCWNVCKFWRDIWKALIW